MSLVGDSKIVILDEPTANLDLITKYKVCGLYK
jgi:ABC-type multidrug transport system ATPase subunit